MKIPQLLLNLIFVAIIYSVIQTLLVQKIKELPFIKKGLKDMGGKFCFIIRNRHMLLYVFLFAIHILCFMGRIVQFHRCKCNL